MTTEDTKITDERLIAAYRDLPGYGLDSDDEGKPDNGGRGYIGWSPHADHLWKEREGWDGRVIIETWETFKKDWLHDGHDMDMNLPVDFYFGLTCDTEKCPDCGGIGYEPRAKHLHDTFYAHSIMATKTGQAFDLNGFLQRKPGSVPEWFAFGGPDQEAQQQAWRDKITVDECQALVDEGRLRSYTHDFNPEAHGAERWTPKPNLDMEELTKKVNEANAPGAKGFGHDAINEHILIHARAKRLYGLSAEECRCPRCKGEGYVRTGPDRLYLYVWMAHPRKGATRGIDIKSVQPEDLPEVKAWLREAWEIHKRHWAWALAPDTRAEEVEVRDSFGQHHVIGV